MRYGVCIGEDYTKIKAASDCGFDYIETCFSLLAFQTDEYFDKFKSELIKYGICAESANCFFPGDIRTVGENMDLEAIKEYVEKGFKRAVSLGVKTIVFGSGGSRGLDEKTTYRNAVRDIVDMLKNAVAPLSEKYDITVVIEPLSDCNFINTVKEGVIISSLAQSESIKCLCDLFHMCKVGDTYDTIKSVKGSIYHSHIAEPEKRVFPKNGDKWNYKEYINALEFIGCERCSIEADTDNFENDIKESAKLLINK